MVPLNAIRAFVLSARTSSFTEAARLLNVTQGAVSQHSRTPRTLPRGQTVRAFRAAPDADRPTVARSTLPSPQAWSESITWPLLPVRGNSISR